VRHEFIDVIARDVVVIVGAGHHFDLFFVVIVACDVEVIRGIVIGGSCIDPDAFIESVESITELHRRILFTAIAPSSFECASSEIAMNKKQHLHRARILATECIRAPAMASTLFGEEAVSAAVYFFLRACFEEEEVVAGACDKECDRAFDVLLCAPCEVECDAAVRCW
jgi:hypothetical protein